MFNIFNILIFQYVLIILICSMEQWLANMAHIESHNFNYALGHKTYSLGMNHYGDLSSTEFAAQYNGFLNSKRGMHVGEDYTEHEDDDKARVFFWSFLQTCR